MVWYGVPLSWRASWRHHEVRAWLLLSPASGEADVAGCVSSSGLLEALVPQ